MNDESKIERHHVEASAITDYQVFLAEPSRPPSKGGNTAALHRHVIAIDGARYSFLALGARKWVFAGDTVAFEWSFDSTGTYRNIAKDTLCTWDRKGAAVVRGNRGWKTQLRTAPTRLPARRSDWKD